VSEDAITTLQPTGLQNRRWSQNYSCYSYHKYTAAC